jgi:predicted ABC-type transport system involved in lysophospholipase L1 biosynthesis ATPase subunit
LSSSNAQKILLARSIISRPKILFYEDPTDNMDDKVANEIIDFITAKTPMDHYCIIKNQYWKSKCNRNITLKNGQIILDLKNN